VEIDKMDTERLRTSWCLVSRGICMVLRSSAYLDFGCANRISDLLFASISICLLLSCFPTPHLSLDTQGITCRVK
jgi:hypothetical protein